MTDERTEETLVAFAPSLVPASPLSKHEMATSALTSGLTPAVPARITMPVSLGEAVDKWLEAKAKRNESGRTLAAYSEAMSRFRLRLQAVGLDLDSADERLIADVAEAFASERSVRGRGAGKPVAPGTYNQRLAVISSFYDYARRRRLLTRANPLEMVERIHDEAYKSAAPLDARVIAAALDKIDGDTLLGMRDYALLTIGLSTGRRLAELAALTWGNVQIAGGVVTLIFPHAKGGKELRDELEPPVGEALMRWVYRWYGSGVGLPPTAPLWVALEPNSRGHQLTHQAISDMCKRRLGTSKVHALRHSFAHGMEAVGAPVSRIQERLGHSNIATTGRYLTKLRGAKNVHAADLVKLFGIK